MSPVAQAFYGHSAHRGTPTAPSFRAGNTASQASGTSLAITVPTSGSGGTVAAGDYGFIIVNVAGSTCSTPSGWTLLGFNSDNGPYSPGSEVDLSVFMKILAAGDLGATVTFTIGSAVTSAAVLYIAKNTNGIGVELAMSQDVNPGQSGGATPRIPGIYPGQNDLVVCFGGTKSFISLGTGTATLTTAPSGFTIRENVSNASGVFALASGAWVCDGPASSAGVNTTLAPASNQDWNVSGVLTLTPTGRRPTNQLPASLRGAALHTYGESYQCYVGCALAAAPWGLYACTTMTDRIRNQMGATVWKDFGLSGAFSGDISGYAYGTIVYNSQSLTGVIGSTSRAGTWSAETTKTGLVIVDAIGNDAINDSNNSSGATARTSANSRVGATNALDALIRLIRSSSVVLHTDASVAKSGTFSTLSKTDYAGGTACGTSTPGNTITITTTQQSIDLVMFAFDDAQFGSTGATFSVTVNGTLLTTGTESNQMARSASSVYNESPYTQMCVPCYNMGSGTNTIVITHTGSSGQELYFNGYLVPSATPPIVLVNKYAHYSSTLYTTLASDGITCSDSQFDIYSAIIGTVVSRFTDGKVLYFDPLHSGEWNYTTMVNTQDDLHPLDNGIAFFTHGMMKVLSEQVA